MKVSNLVRIKEERRSALGEKAGFTLMEVGVAAVVLTIVFMGTFGALIVGFNLIESARDTTRSAQMLQSEFEELRTMNWTDVTALPASETYSPSNDFVLAFGDRYRLTRTITSRAADQKEISVAVNWRDKSGSTKSLEYITWYTEDGFSDYYFRKF